MALRIKRGTDADRTGYTPESGEPIWTIDTNKLYVGDGSTAGGILVTGAGGGGSTPGIDDTATGVVLTITDLASTFTNDIEVDADLVLGGGEINGTGDINILGNITASGTLTGNIANLGSVNVTAGISAGGTVSAPYFVGDHLGSVFADDSSILVDAVAGNIRATQYLPPANAFIIGHNGTTSENALSIRALDNRSILTFSRESDSDLSGDLTIQYGGIIFQRDDVSGALATSVILGRGDGLYFGSDAGGDFTTADKFVVVKSGKVGIKNTSPTVELDVTGDANITGSLTAGAMLLSGSNIDTDDSSAITVTPATTFSSDVTVENNMTVTNTLTVDTLEVTNFQTVGAGTPELESATDILLTAGTRVTVTQSPFKVASFTTVERDALSAENGDIIYNTTDNKFQGYENGAWANLI